MAQQQTNLAVSIFGTLEGAGIERFVLAEICLAKIDHFPPKDKRI